MSEETMAKLEQPTDSANLLDQYAGNNGWSRRDILGLSAAAIAALILPGCGGGGGGGSQDEADFFRATNVSVKDNVRVIPDDGTITITDQTPTGLTLNGPVPAIAPGDVIVSGIGAGLMLKVLTATPGPSGTVLETEPAALTDVFNSANVEFRMGLNTDHVQEIQTHIPGVVIGRGREEGRGRAATAFPVTVPKTFVGDQTSPTEKVGVEIEVNGTIGIGLIGGFDITLANGLERLYVYHSAVWIGTYKLALQAEVESSFLKKEVPFATFIFNPIPLGAIGPVPIILLPVLHLQLVTGGTVTGGWDTSGNGRAVYVMGLDYRQDPLGSPFSLSQITPTASTKTHTGGFVASNFFGNAKFEASGWQPELLTSFNGLIGPVFKADIPAVAVELKANSATKAVVLTAQGIWRGRVGAEAGMFGMSWPLFESTIAESTFDIITPRTFQPGTGNVGIS